MKESTRNLLRILVTVISFVVVIFYELKILFTSRYLACGLSGTISIIFFFAFIVLWIVLMFFLKANRKTLIKSGIFLVIFIILIFLLRSGMNIDYRHPNAINSQRWSHIKDILTVTEIYELDHQGAYLKCKGNPDYEIPETETCLGTDSNCCDLSDELIEEGYFAKFPEDPVIGTELNSGYTIVRDNEGICLGAPHVEAICDEKEEIKVCR